MRLRQEVKEFLLNINHKILQAVFYTIAAVAYAFLCISKLFIGSIPNPGLFGGIMDGWASPIMALVDIFNSDVEMFISPHKNGYGIGFFLGVIIALVCIIGLLVEDDDGGGGGGKGKPTPNPQPLQKQPLPKQETDVEEKPRFDVSSLN